MLHPSLVVPVPSLVVASLEDTPQVALLRLAALLQVALLRLVVLRLRAVKIRWLPCWVAVALALLRVVLLALLLRALVVLLRLRVALLALPSAANSTRLFSSNHATASCTQGQGAVVF